MIKTLIIEDEKTAADRIEKLLLEIDPGIEILDKLQGISSAVSWFKKNSDPDLIILDIQLADGISFEIFKQVKVESFVIFTTAFDEYAIRAFELNSIDYLLKPIEKKKLEQSLEKFNKLKPVKQGVDINSLIDTIQAQQKNYKNRFLVSAGEKIKSLNTRDIAFFYSSEKSTFLCTYEDRHYPVEFSLDTLENLLDPDLFFRINRQFIAGRGALDKIYVLSGSRIKIEPKPSVKANVYVSKARTHEFREWLDQ